uniref:Thyroglobulin type-1 domain-containing protein n=1 Tax=Macrostomum lignano TaxID=282301 RepID=A0A1I8FQH4_9PLAT
VGVGPELDKFQQRRADAACLTLTDALRCASRQRAGHSTVVRFLHPTASVRIRTTETHPPTHVDIVASCSVGEPLTAQGLLKRADRTLIRTGLQLTAQQQALVSPIVACGSGSRPGPSCRTVRRYCWRLRARRDAAACTRSQQLVGLSLGWSALQTAPSPASRTSAAAASPTRVGQAKKVAEKAAASDSGDPNSKLASQTDPESAAYLDLCGAGSPQDDSLQTPGSSAPIGVFASPTEPPWAACQCLQTRCDLQLGETCPPVWTCTAAGWPSLLACLASVACGHHTLLMPAGALSIEIPALPGAAGFLQMLAQRSVRDALCGYELLDRCCARLQPESVKPGQPPGPSSCLGTDRPRANCSRSSAACWCAGPQPDSPALLIRLPRQPLSDPCRPQTLTPTRQRSYADARALRQDRLVPVDSDSPNA